MSKYPWIVVCVSLMMVACSDDPDEPEPVDDGRDLIEALSEIEQVANIVELTTSEPGHQSVVFDFEQLVDHNDPDGPVFSQLVTLSHRSYAAPMILATTGYHNYLFDELSEPAVLLDANQVVVEHRFFQASRPDPADWSVLTVEQAAADHHRIVEALKPLYPGAWVSTGASKGGMTSVYHRRFYPDDVDATIAYVAPHSDAPLDASYVPFFDTVGDATCRQAVRDYQRDALTRLANLVPLADDLAAVRRYTFDRLGGTEAAMEAALSEFEWGFWQYMGPVFCDIVPTSASTDQEVFDFLGLINSVDLVSDRTIELFEPYYFQAESELGYPASATAHIDDLLTYEFDINAYLPTGETATHDPQTMADIASWVRTESSEILFLYGQWDPWTAGAFDVGDNTAVDVFIAPRENHNALLADLLDEDRQIAFDLIETWTGATIGDPSASARSLLRPVAPRPLMMRVRR